VPRYQVPFQADRKTADRKTNPIPFVAGTFFCPLFFCRLAFLSEKSGDKSPHSKGRNPTSALQPIGSVRGEFGEQVVAGVAFLAANLDRALDP
jgi:hypothetical protein